MQVTDSPQIDPALTEKLLGAGTWSIDLERGTFVMSSECRTILSACLDSAEEIMTLPILLDLLSPDDRRRFSQALHHSESPEQPMTVRSGECALVFNWRKRDSLCQGVVWKSDDLSTAIKLEADSASLAHNRFLANISHELRTPLTAILGFLQLISQSEEFDRNQVRNVEHATENGQKLQSLIDNVLKMAKIESNQMELQTGPFNFRELIAAMDTTYGPSAELKGLQFDTTVEAGSDVVVGDLEKIRHIIGALLDNAIKFTSRGMVRLTVRREQQFLVIEVTDTGCGIDAQDQQHLFKPFQQRLDYQSEHGQSIGLGLAICKSHVDLMQGEIAVQSSTGEGASFTIRLPLFSDKFSDKSGAEFQNESDDAAGASPGAADADDDFIIDDDEINNAEWEMLTDAVDDLDGELKQELVDAILSADPGGFREILDGTGIDAIYAHQMEFLVSSYQYDEVLNLLVSPS
jgi:signal transduction histidine kinase